ncbi:MAG: BBP7 family outer membrane beta-barrel protein [Rubripirellula sp.]
MLTLQRTISFSLVALVIATCGPVASAQTRSNTSSSSSRRSVRTTEKAARANWQPTRETTKSGNTQQSTLVEAAVEPAFALKPAPARQTNTKNQSNTKKSVRPVGHVSSGGIPVPPDDSMSIVDSTYSHYDEHEILDGQVMMSPMEGEVIYEGDMSSSSCDSMGGCGCGDVFCTGGCDSMGGGCDSGTCGSSGCNSCGELIGGNAWRPCVTLCMPQDGWFSAEYLMWFQDGMELPPLVTTSPTGTNVNQAGVLGGPSSILFGGNKVLEDSIDGFRLNFGVWLDGCHTWGLGGEYFKIGQESESFSATSSGATILARPFFNVNPTTGAAREDAELVSFPNVITGTVSATASSELFGAGIHLRHLRMANEGCTSGLFCGCPGHFCSRQEVMFGYRYLQLDESVNIRENLRGLDPVSTFSILDTFETQNQFNGFDLGWKYRRTRGYWSADALLRMAFGVTNQTVRIDGSTVSTDSTGTQVSSSGGLLAQRTNIGIYEQDEFSVIPQLDLNLGYQLTDHLRATVGYTFLYWSNVVRPGDQIDRDLNPALLPPEQDPFTGASRPGFKFDTTDYWAQGISIGGEYRW